MLNSINSHVLWNKVRTDTSRCGKKLIHANSSLFWQLSHGNDWRVELQLEKPIQSIIRREGIAWTIIKNSGNTEFLDFDKSYEPQRNKLSKHGVFRA